jgi:DNA-binding XRE family transcriptional regulator
MPKREITSPLSVALRRVRHHLDFQQGDLASRLGVSRRTIVRWERGEAAPPPPEAQSIVTRLNDLPFEILEPLGRALGVVLRRSPTSDTTKRVLDDHLRLVAEGADVSAKRLREAVVAVLRKASELGLTAEQAAALVKGGSGEG